MRSALSACILDRRGKALHFELLANQIRVILQFSWPAWYTSTLKSVSLAKLNKDYSAVINVPSWSKVTLIPRNLTLLSDWYSKIFRVISNPPRQFNDVVAPLRTRFQRKSLSDGLPPLRQREWKNEIRTCSATENWSNGGWIGGGSSCNFRLV